MASSEYEGGTGGKFRKRPLKRVHSTPYNRPPSAARGLSGTPPVAVSRSSRWLLNIVDPASRAIARNASRLFSSVFRKGLASPPGDNHNTIEDVPEVRPPPELTEHGDNSFDGRLSIHCDGIDRYEQESISGAEDIFEVEQLVKQKTFSRSETERLTELLQSRTIEPSPLPSADYKEKARLDEDSNIEPGFSQQAVNHEGKKKENTSILEDQKTQLVTLHTHVSSGVNANIPAEGFASPIEIARAYMGSKSLKAAPSTLHLKQSPIYLRDKGSPFSFPFGNKQPSSADTSKSAGFFPVVSADTGNDYISPKPRGISALYKLPRSPYCRSPVLTNTREYSPYKGSNIGSTKLIEWTPSSSNTRHSVQGQALKRGSSDNDVGGFGDVRRVRQKSCLKDLRPSTSSHSQGYINEIDLKVLENVDGNLPSESVLPVPQSTQMARKILHQLDKLVPSPRNLSSEKKVTFGDASFSNSYWGAFHEVSKKSKGNYCSTKLENFPGISSFGQSTSTLARIINSASDKHKAKEVESSPIPSISGTEATSSFFGMNSDITSASDAKNSMRSTTNANSHEFSFPYMQKDPILQSVPDDKGGSKKPEHAIFSSVKESRETSLIHSVRFAPTSGLIHETGIEAPVGPTTKKDVSFKFTAAHASSTLSKPHLSSTMTTVISTDLMAKTMGTSASVQTEGTVMDCTAAHELNKRDSATCTLQNENSVPSTLFTSTGISASSSNPSSPPDAPRFQFSSGNSTIYSFTGLSAASSSLGDVSNTSNGASKYQFGSGHSASYSFAGVAAYSSQGGVPSLIFSSILPNSSFPFASSSSQNSTMNFGTSLSPLTSGLGFAMSGAKPSSSSSSFLPPSVPTSFFATIPSLASHPLRTTAGSTPLSSPSTGTTTLTTLSPGKPVFRLTNAAAGLGSGFPSNVPASLENSGADGDDEATQAFQSGNFRNNSASSSPPFQESGNLGFLAGGSFSLGSGGTEKTERKFIRVRRDKRRK